eukprot:3073251-Pyramimonas_sp.AAC.1
MAKRPAHPTDTSRGATERNYSKGKGMEEEEEEEKQGGEEEVEEQEEEEAEEQEEQVDQEGERQRSTNTTAISRTREQEGDSQMPRTSSHPRRAGRTEFAIQERGLDMAPTVSSTECRTARFRNPSLVQRICLRAIQNPWFDCFMSVIVSMNSVVIGLEIQESIDRQAPTSVAYQVMESCFLVSYVFELSLRLLADWQECLQSSWFKMDIALVALGMVTIWVLEPLLLMGDTVGVLDKLLVLRVLRLIRLVRTFRFLKSMQPFWKLVKGMLVSNGSVLWAAVLLFGAIYVFACVGVAVIGANEELLSDPIVGEIVADRFRSIPVLMITLLQFTLCDGAAQIYHPLVRAKPVLLCFFLPALLTMPIALMNLITAAVLNHAIKVSSHDAELER